MSVAERPPGQLKRLFGKICALRIFAGPIRLLHLVLQQLPLLLGISRWRLRARGPSDDEGEHYRQSYTAETGSASHPAPPIGLHSMRMYGAHTRGSRSL